MENIEKPTTWTITAQFTVFAGDMDKKDVIDNAQAILESLTDGSDINGITITEAERDHF